MSLKDLLFLLWAYGILLDIGIQMIVPSFAALFTCPAIYFVLFLEFLSNESPSFCAIFVYQIFDGFIFLRFIKKSEIIQK